jgi:hypothetical protein
VDLESHLIEESSLGLGDHLREGKG